MQIQVSSPNNWGALRQREVYTRNTAERNAVACAGYLSVCAHCREEEKFKQSTEKRRVICLIFVASLRHKQPQQKRNAKQWFWIQNGSVWARIRLRGFDTDATGTEPEAEAAATDIFINEECDQKSNEVLIVPRMREREREQSKDIYAFPWA